MVPPPWFLPQTSSPDHVTNFSAIELIFVWLIEFDFGKGAKQKTQKEGIRVPFFHFRFVIIYNKKDIDLYDFIFILSF